MYINKKEEKYWVYDCCKNVFVRYFLSKKALLKWLFNTNWFNPWNPRQQNSLFQNVNMNGNDEKLSMDDRGMLCYTIRPYLIMDSQERIVDIRNWNIEAIMKEPDNPSKRKNYNNSNHKRCYGHMRTPHMYQAFRDFSNEELKPYIRPKRGKNYLINYYYDDVWTQASKSWKDQSKKKRQWM